MAHVLPLLWLALATGAAAQSACEAPILLKSRVSQNQLLLDWKPGWGQTAWRVVGATRPDLADSTLLGTALSPAWSWQMIPGDTRRFFNVRAVDGPPLPAEAPIETFEWMPPLQSWADQDLEPTAWEQDAAQHAEGAASLHLYGNTVKAQLLGGPVLGFGEVWRVSARVDGVADRQMVGFADSLNVLWYVLWGRRGGYEDTPGQSGQVEVSCYQGWFPEHQWVQALLPVGQDWQGKYGYLPRVCSVLWANECDDNAGEVWFDDLRRVDPGAAGPVASPQFSVQGQVGDSLLVTLWNAAPAVTQTWSLGDGRRATGDNLSVRLLAARAHRVGLVAEDGEGRWDAGSVVVPGGAAPRSVTLAFGGDVMTARAYEAPGGIIETQGVNAIFDSLRAELQSVDLALFNLECSYTTATTEHPTKAITFKSRPQNLDGIRDSGADFVSLANNHVFDWLEAGLQETIAGLAARGIPHSGAGMNSTRARRPVLLSGNGLGVGVTAFCDRTGNYNNAQPFLEAGLARPGFSLWSRGDMQAVIPALRDKVDLLVLQAHSGNEYSTQPSLAAPAGTSPEDRGALAPTDGAALAADDGLAFNPDLRGLNSRELLPDQSERALRHEAVDLGARLVITHHPHILQGVEVYHGGLIAHSLGNLVMDLSYQETMSSLLLEVEDNGQALQSAWLQPVFIENYKPRLCRGETAALLLDHMTRVSRPFDTWVLRQPGAERAWVALDTLALLFSSSAAQETLPLESRGGWWVSPPWRIAGEGQLAQLRLLSAATGAQIRLGRDACWWGNMEDEGAGIWDINSAQEGYVADVSHRGERSLWQSDSGGSTVYTYYTVRAPLDTDAAWSACGWVRTQAAGSAVIQVRWYATRTADVTSTTNLTSVTGTQDWTRVWQDLSPPAGTNFYQFRLGLSTPVGPATAWYDDVSLIEWDGWQGLVSQTPLPVRTPNDLQWAQVRVPTSAASLLLEWTRRSCLNPPSEISTH